MDAPPPDLRIVPAPAWGHVRLEGPGTAPVTIVCSRQADADEVARRAVEYPGLVAELARLRRRAAELEDAQIEGCLADVRGAGA